MAPKSASTDDQDMQPGYETGDGSITVFARLSTAGPRPCPDAHLRSLEHPATALSLIVLLYMRQVPYPDVVGRLLPFPGCSEAIPRIHTGPYAGRHELMCLLDKPNSKSELQ